MNRFIRLLHSKLPPCKIEEVEAAFYSLKKKYGFMPMKTLLYRLEYTLFDVMKPWELTDFTPEEQEDILKAWKKEASKRPVYDLSREQSERDRYETIIYELLTYIASCNFPPDLTK